jgi:dTDP-4-amino-4,6-dideoxygalactose transaminase
MTRLNLRKSLHNPYKIVKMFEEEIADYTGSPYAVSVDSCTNALFLCCKYLKVKEVEIPSKTYLSVPQSIINSGGEVVFNPSLNDWKGIYQLSPYPIYDSAKRFTSEMYIPGSLMCISFHIKKHLKIGKGGMILTDDANAVEKIKKMRYEGRTQNVSYHIDELGDGGWNMYMTPEQAARGLTLLSDYPQNSPDQIENPPYRDLREFNLFKNKI